MQSAIKGLVILLLGAAIGLLFFLSVQTAVGTFNPMEGMSPAMQWLMSLRAAENGGQIAPSFEQLGIDPSQLAARMAAGGSPGGSGGFAGRGSSGLGARGPVALSRNFAPDQAPAHEVRDLTLMLSAAVVAAIVELVVFALARRRRMKAQPA